MLRSSLRALGTVLLAAVFFLSSTAAADDYIPQADGSSFDQMLLEYRSYLELLHAIPLAPEPRQSIAPAPGSNPTLRVSNEQETTRWKALDNNTCSQTTEKTWTETRRLNGCTQNTRWAKVTVTAYDPCLGAMVLPGASSHVLITQTGISSCHGDCPKSSHSIITNNMGQPFNSGSITSDIIHIWTRSNIGNVDSESITETGTVSTANGQTAKGTLVQTPANGSVGGSFNMDVTTDLQVIDTRRGPQVQMSNVKNLGLGPRSFKLSCW